MEQQKTFEGAGGVPDGGRVRPHSARRTFLGRALGLGAGALAVGGPGRRATAAVSPINDAAIMNFALNFEYLGAEYYTYGVFGVSSSSAGVNFNGMMGPPGPTIVKSNPQVPFATPLLRQFFTELARDEQGHAKFLRMTLTEFGAAPIAKPTIDLLNSFNSAAMMAGLPTPFDPFANEVNFLIGSYILEDVCVTALHGAAPLISNRDVLDGAAGLLGVESYHAGAIRTLMYQRNQGSVSDAISAVRRAASGANDDYGVDDGPLDMGPAGNSSLVLADPNAMVFARTFRQVLNIAYLSPASAQATSGGFFPNGVNGTIRG